MKKSLEEMFNIPQVTRAVQITMSDLLLTIKYNPTNHSIHFDPSLLPEAIGLIPHFFAMCMNCETLEEVADEMNNQYGYGWGFSGSSFKGEIDENGVYTSPHEEGDEVFIPWAKCTFKAPYLPHISGTKADNFILPYVTPYAQTVTCWCYESAITGITDGKTSIIGRFD
jgi:hypothetical protein